MSSSTFHDKIIPFNVVFADAFGYKTLKHLPRGYLTLANLNSAVLKTIFSLLFNLSLILGTELFFFNVTIFSRIVSGSEES